MFGIGNVSLLAAASGGLNIPNSLLVDLEAYYALADLSDSHIHGHTLDETLPGVGGVGSSGGINGGCLDGSTGDFAFDPGAFDFNDKSYGASFWFNSSDTLTGATLVSWTSFGGWSVRLSDDTVSHNHYDGANWNGISSPVLADLWNHIAVSYNKLTGLLDLYLNGALGARVTGISPLAASSSPQFCINGEFPTPSASIALIDEVAVWYRPLSPSNVASLYAGGAGKFYPAFT